MSGETVERPRSRLILASLASICFLMLALGIAFAFIRMGVSSQQSWLAFTLMLSNFLIGLFIFMRGQGARGEKPGWKDWLVFAVPSLLILRGMGIVQEGTGVNFEESGWFIGSFATVMSVSTMVMAVILAGIWQTASFLARNIEELHPQQSEIPPSVNSPEYYGWMTSSARWIDRSAAVGKITTGGILGGGLLTATTAVTAGGLAGSGADAISPAAPLTILVFYFIGLLVLHSYASLVRQTSTWSMQLAQQATGITENWVRSSLLVLGFALLIAIFIPAFHVPDAYGFWATLARIVVVMWQIMMLPVLAVIALLAKFFSLLQFGASSAESPPPAQQISEIEQVDDSPLEFLQAGLMWVVLAFTAYLIYKRLTNSRPNWKTGRLAKIALATIGAFFKSIMLGLASLIQLSGDVAKLLTVQTVARALAAVGLRKAQAFSGDEQTEALSNREHVWQTYLNTLREAERVGIDRTPNQTAIEYQRNLLEVFGPEKSDVTELTLAFIRARYMRAPIDDELVAGVRGNGDRIRAFLRALR